MRRTPIRPQGQARALTKSSGWFGGSVGLQPRILKIRIVIPSGAAWGPTQWGKRSEGSASAFCEAPTTKQQRMPHPSALFGKVGNRNSFVGIASRSRRRCRAQTPQWEALCRHHPPAVASPASCGSTRPPPRHPPPPTPLRQSLPSASSGNVPLALGSDQIHVCKLQILGCLPYIFAPILFRVGGWVHQRARTST